MTQQLPRAFRDVQLTGTKVRLRPVHMADAPAGYELFRDDRVVRNLVYEAPQSLAEEEGFCKLASQLPWVQEGGRASYNLTIEDIRTPGIVGVVALHRQLNPLQFEVGYWVGVPHWGRGYATDAVRLAVHFGFTYLNAARVFAPVFRGNDASRRVVEKNNFHLDATRRSQFLKRGQWLDDWFFTLLRSEWEAHSEWYRPQSEHVAPMSSG